MFYQLFSYNQSKCLDLFHLFNQFLVIRLFNCIEDSLACVDMGLVLTFRPVGINVKAYNHSNLVLCASVFYNYPSYSLGNPYYIHSWRWHDNLVGRGNSLSLAPLVSPIYPLVSKKEFGCMTMAMDRIVIPTFWFSVDYIDVVAEHVAGIVVEVVDMLVADTKRAQHSLPGAMATGEDNGLYFPLTTIL